MEIEWSVLRKIGVKKVNKILKLNLSTAHQPTPRRKRKALRTETLSHKFEKATERSSFRILYRRTLKMSCRKFNFFLFDCCRYYTKDAFVYDNFLVNWYKVAQQFWFANLEKKADQAQNFTLFTLSFLQRHFLSRVVFLVMLKTEYFNRSYKIERHNADKISKQLFIRPFKFSSVSMLE